MTDDGTPRTASLVPALTDAIESQNLYHGRHGTVPAGEAAALAILACLRNHHGIDLEARALVTPTPRTEGLRADLRAFIENVEIAAEDNGTKAVLIKDLWAFYRDWVRALVTPDPAPEALDDLMRVARDLASLPCQCGVAWTGRGRHQEECDWITMEIYGLHEVVAALSEADHADCPACVRGDRDTHAQHIARGADHAD